MCKIHWAIHRICRRISWSFKMLRLGSRLLKIRLIVFYSRIQGVHLVCCTKFWISRLTREAILNKIQSSKVKPTNKSSTWARSKTTQPKIKPRVLPNRWQKSNFPTSTKFTTKNRRASTNLQPKTTLRAPLQTPRSLTTDQSLMTSNLYSKLNSLLSSPKTKTRKSV